MFLTNQILVSFPCRGSEESTYSYLGMEGNKGGLPLLLSVLNLTKFYDFSLQGEHGFCAFFEAEF